MSSQLHSAKVMFFDVGATEFEQTPVYRRGFNTVILLLKGTVTNRDIFSIDFRSDGLARVHCIITFCSILAI